MWNRRPAQAQVVDVEVVCSSSSCHSSSYNLPSPSTPHREFASLLNLTTTTRLMANDGLIPLDSKELAPLTGDSASTRPLHNDEYSRTQHGIYAQWLFDIKSRPAPSSKSTSIFTRLQGMFIGPWFESHWKKLTQLATRLPLLVRLNVGLAKGNGWSFGCVLLTKFLGSFTPARKSSRWREIKRPKAYPRPLQYKCTTTKGS